MASTDGVCLVARAVPMPDSASKNVSTMPTDADSLAAHFDAALSLDAKKPAEEKKMVVEKPKTDAEKEAKMKQRREELEDISPADHLALQSLRSSALARKTNTTAKFSRDCRNLFADLMMGTEEEEATEKKKKEEKEEKKDDDEKNEEMKKKAEGEEEKKEETKEVKKEEEEEQTKEGAKKEEAEAPEGDRVKLLARGPIRAPTMGRTACSAAYHPYSAGMPMMPNSNELLGMPPSVMSFNAAAPQSAVLDQSSYNPMAAAGYGYECGLPSNWSCGGWSAGRDSVLSSPSTTPDTTLVMSPGGRSERSELPDDLSDFILEYSRRYSPRLTRKHSFGSEHDEGASPRSNVSEEEHLCLTGGGDSPLCAPQSSPAAPRGGGMAKGSRSPPFADGASFTGTLLAGVKGEERPRPAKERLRALIRSEDMDDAWAWTCKCIQRHPGALSFQDGDGDTLLHIVTAHLDLAKIYALVEQMLKSDKVQQQQTLPFDVPNRLGETPLMVAVQKRQVEVVGYLLEAGASPNSQSCRLERDTPLHYAAARGMAHIVSTLCSHPTTELNAQNGMGLSPLLSAFKNHGVLEEESQRAVCNLEAARVLLQVGADATVVDATNGRTLVHYAVEKMDARLVELLRANVEERLMTELVNRADFCGETPMRTLEGLEGGDEAAVEGQRPRAQLCLALITCGAKAQ